MKKIYTIVRVISRVAQLAGKILPIFNGKGKTTKAIKVSNEVKEVTDAIQETEGCSAN